MSNTVDFLLSMTNADKKEKQKRKHKTLSIQEKVQLLKLLDEGTSVGRLCEIFSVGSSTIYDIKKKKDDLLKFYAERQSKRGVPVRKTMKEGKCSELERALVEWFELRRSEGETVTGGMLVEQAKKLHEELKLNFQCKYSHGWLDKFKNRHGIKLYTLEDEKPDDDSSKASTLVEVECGGFEDMIGPVESEAEHNFLKKFLQAVTTEQLHAEQVYSANQTSLPWRQLPNEILASGGSEFKERMDPDERVTVFSCFNATGTHRCKLLVVGRNSRPKAFEGVNVLPVIYRANEQNCVTREIIMDWLENHFAAEAKMHYSIQGFPQNCKVLLILDSNLAPSNEEFLVIDNVHILFFPFDSSFPFHPHDQGILRWLKSWYRLECMTCCLEALTKQKSAEEFIDEFNIKDAMWTLARAWENVSEVVMRYSWHKMWPDLIYEDPSEKDIAEMYTNYKHQVINHVLEYVKSANSGLGKYMCYKSLEEWMEKDDEEDSGSSFHIKSEETVCGSRKGKGDCEASSVKSKENVISIEDCLHLTSQLISGLEKQNFITEQEIMYLYRLKANLISEKLKHSASETKESECAEKTEDVEMLLPHENE